MDNGKPTMTHKEQINKQLYDKVSAEKKAFFEHLKTLPPEDIISKAYEIAVKEDILLSLEYHDLPVNKAKALLKETDALDGLYSCWINSDFNEDYMDGVQNCVEYYAGEAVKNKAAQTQER
jgi:hypothetical protein